MTRFPICGTKMKKTFLLCFVLYFRALGAEHASCNVLRENMSLYIYF